MVSSGTLYLAFLLLLGAERLFELRLSKRNAARAFARGGREAGQGHFRVMAALHTLFLFACAAEVVLLDRRFEPRVGFWALGGALGAQGLRYWAIHALGDRWNVRIIVEPEVPPVSTGPYRFVRHPNYVAVILELLFVPLIHGAYWTAAVFSVCNALLLVVRIRAEERALGTLYVDRFAQHPRFLPGLRRS